MNPNDGNTPAEPQHTGGNTNPQNADPDQDIDDDSIEDHDGDEPPELLSTEELEEENRQYTELFDQMRRNAASNGRNAPPPTANDNSHLKRTLDINLMGSLFIPWKILSSKLVYVTMLKYNLHAKAQNSPAAFGNT